MSNLFGSRELEEHERIPFGVINQAIEDLETYADSDSQKDRNRFLSAYQYLGLGPSKCNKCGNLTSAHDMCYTLMVNHREVFVCRFCGKRLNGQPIENYPLSFENICLKHRANADYIRNKIKKEILGQ